MARVKAPSERENQPLPLSALDNSATRYTFTPPTVRNLLHIAGVEDTMDYKLIGKAIT